MIDISDETLRNAYIASSEARNALTRVDDNLVSIHHGKVCSICDRLIRYTHERFYPIKKFNQDRMKSLFHQDNIPDVYHLDKYVKRSLNAYYTQKWFRDDSDKWLNKMILSPSSYGRVSTKNVKEIACCKQCHSAMIALGRKDAKKICLPHFAIADGLIIGSPPLELSRLNEVELALISPARINKHIFAYSAGSHKSIRGWHTMYANNVEQTNRVMNYFSTKVQDNDDSDNSSTDSDEDYNASESTMSNESSEDETMDNTNHENLQSEERAECVTSKTNYIPEITVILAGPFTKNQLALTKKKTKVSVQFVKEGLRWLKSSNIQFRNIDLNKEISIPEVIESYEIAESSKSNIEDVIEVTAIFPDPNEPTTCNGGYTTITEFKKNTLDMLTSEECEKNATVIARSSSTILRDYIGSNLLKAFPLQFPYGIGNLNNEGEERYSVPYMQYLTTLSSPNFHRAEFNTILYNMCERKRLVTSSFLKVSDDERTNIGELTEEKLKLATERYLRNEKGTTPADMYLQKIQAIAGSMANSESASNSARQKMFSMISRFGLPSVLFTITPEDSMNFRIKIMSHGLNGCKDPPPLGSTDTVLNEFVIQSAYIRTDYPGLCSFDFENILAITIHLFLGWDEKKNENIPEAGIFGDLNGWCYAVEEQGRKTLHSHFLLWVKNWDKVLDGLGNMSKRDQYAEIMQTYAAKIMNAQLHSVENLDCSCGSSLKNHEKCSDQDLRNLRSCEGTSSLGHACILKCPNCCEAYTSEDLIMKNLDQILGYIPTNESDEDFALDCKTLLSKSQVMTKRQVMMEMHIMHEFIKQQKEHFIPPENSDEYKKTLFIITTLRNLHSSDHRKKCFSKDWECRMKIPKKATDSTSVTFEEEKTPWFTWKGQKVDRNLFVYEAERRLEDCYVNINNIIASMVIGCNTNCVNGVDGGSVMYITCYVSKSTQKDDKSVFAKAAKIMIQKIREKENSVSNAVRHCTN